MRYNFIQEHRYEYRIILMCRGLNVSRSGYYAWRDRAESARDRTNRLLVSQIRMVHERFRRVYGSPRITAELRAQGVVCSENRVARLMRWAGLRAKTVKKYRLTTDSRHSLAIAPNLLARQFTVERLNTVWASDITYIWTSQGWLYLAVVLDLCSRQVVGWAMSDRGDEQLILAALHQALRRRRLVDQPLHHSDRGVQYAAGDYRKLLRDNGITCSMSRRGNCWDNAVVESFFATLKKELVRHERFQTKAEAKAKIFEYIEVFYNRVRRHSSLGQISPAQFEQTTTLA